MNNGWAETKRSFERSNSKKKDQSNAIDNIGREENQR